MKFSIDSYVGAEPEDVLKSVFGYDSFRYAQKDIIESVLGGKDTLAVMPTGGGKSLCYQIPSLIFDGITLVISPLISLMQDQVSSLKDSGIPSVFLNSALDWQDYLKALEEIKQGKIKIVYVSPEGLSSNVIRDLITSESVKVSCVTIDEAHCISEWGHDFRPDYLEIFHVRKLCPSAVMLALTATATEQVRKDIAKNLGMKSPAIFVSSFNRPNIYLSVKPKIDAFGKVCECIDRHKDGSGIIYCYSRKQVDELASKLKRLKYSVKPYHAGLSDEVRKNNQNAFINDKVQIMVATIAFGMGIDKPNVRFVINYDLPKSIEEYYQEIGRAGRDGKLSEAMLLFTRADVHKIRAFFTDKPHKERIKCENLLECMVDYANSPVCRRKNLLGYFGEKFTPPAGSNYCCDVCDRNQGQMTDVTIPVQKFLCCIIRTNERFGAEYLIDVLLGSRKEKIINYGHNKISTWGIGKELSKNEWFELVDLMISADFIKKDGPYNIVRLTSEGRNLLATRESVYFPIKILPKLK